MGKHLKTFKKIFSTLLSTIYNSILRRFLQLNKCRFISYTTHCEQLLIPRTHKQKMDEDKPVMFLGYDLRKVPCFRDTFLYGISSGIAGGLAVFLFTSKPRIASHCGMATYLAVSSVYWFQCRIFHTKNLITGLVLQEAMEKANVLRGTEEEEEMKKNIVV